MLWLDPTSPAGEGESSGFDFLGGAEEGAEGGFQFPFSQEGEGQEEKFPFFK